MNKFTRNENTLMRFYDMLLDETKMAVEESKRAYYRSDAPDLVADPVIGLSSTVLEISAAIELLVKRLERIDEEKLRKEYETSTSQHFVYDPNTDELWKAMEEHDAKSDNS